jgi:hypothetical protein
MRQQPEVCSVKRSALIWVLVMVIGGSITATAGPYYARGTFYAGSGKPWDVDAGNELFDDGLHGDEAGGDGIYGAYVVTDQFPGQHEFKIATKDWSVNYPYHPVYSLSNAVLYTEALGETVHFRLDTNPVGGGWQPVVNAVSCSHFAPVGSLFEVIGDPPELGDWKQGVPAKFKDDIWSVDVEIDEVGLYEYKFRVLGTWDTCNVGLHYNMFPGDNFTFFTTKPQSEVRFEFDTVAGRARATELGNTPTWTITWGWVKTLYGP